MEGVGVEYVRSWWSYPRDNERNLVAAIFHGISLLLTASALLSMDWFHIWVRGHFCPSDLSIGLRHFLKPPPPPLPLPPPQNIRLLNSQDFLLEIKGCKRLHYLTEDVRGLMQFLITLCILCMSLSTIGLCLDLLGPTKSSLRFLRRNAFPSILAVLGAVSIIGMAYFASESLAVAVQNLNDTSSVRITYGMGCYTITAAGAVSILATTCNLLQDPPQTYESLIRRNCLEEDIEGPETFSVDLNSLPPPPPYTP